MPEISAAKGDAAMKERWKEYRPLLILLGFFALLYLFMVVVICPPDLLIDLDDLFGLLADVAPAYLAVKVSFVYVSWLAVAYLYVQLYRAAKGYLRGEKREQKGEPVSRVVFWRPVLIFVGLFLLGIPAAYWLFVGPGTELLMKVLTACAPVVVPFQMVFPIGAAAALVYLYLLLFRVVRTWQKERK